MKIDMVKISKDLEYIKEANQRNDKEHEEIKTIINDFIKSADKKYANKWIEKIVIGLVISFIGGIALAVVSAILL